MAIIPDTKDWTWVLRRPCPECGFDTRRVPRDAVAALLRHNSLEWVRLLSESDRVNVRPNPRTWSLLEYACHVRDVFRLYDVRLHLMLTQDDPLFPNWDQDVTAVEEHYADQAPAEVGASLREAADALAASFDRVTDEQWERPGRRSDGAAFTVDSFARYLIHDPVHHLYDVTGRRPGPESAP